MHRDSEKTQLKLIIGFDFVILLTIYFMILILHSIFCANVYGSKWKIKTLNSSPYIPNDCSDPAPFCNKMLSNKLQQDSVVPWVLCLSIDPASSMNLTNFREKEILDIKR